MKPIDYSATDAEVRPDLVAAHDRAWQRIGRPGTWWPAETRLAIAAEARVAADCGLCRRRKAALSPYTDDGSHDGLGKLPDTVVEVIHRIVTDPGRLTRHWHEQVIGDELNAAEYVETVGVVATVVMIDTYARAVGLEPPPLPATQAGQPPRYRPDGVGDLGAWVPMIGFDDHQPAEHDLFANGPISNIRASLSSVPDEARTLTTSSIGTMRRGRPKMISSKPSVRSVPPKPSCWRHEYRRSTGASTEPPLTR